MRIVFLVALFGVSFPAAAQMVKCVDERGRTHYTDKPQVDCKTAKETRVISPAPAPAPKSAPKPAAAEKKAAAQKAPLTAEERARLASDCKTNQELLDWLLSARGAGVEYHAARVAQVKQAMRGCP